MIAVAFEFAGYRLLDPWFLLLAPLAVLVLLFRLRRSPAALPTGDAALLLALPRTLRARCVQLPRLLSVLACCLLAVALARPVVREVVPLRQQGIDILLVVDLSSSMLMRDMSKDEKLRRIDAARARAEEFAKARTGDRVGLLVFARYAELRCPPTLDEQALAAFLRALDTVPENSELDGTAIGTALAKSAKVLESSQARSKVVVLLTDGETTVRDIEPDIGAGMCKDAGIRVHTIGLGKGVPTFAGWQPLDFRELKAVATKTGGEFFQPRSDEDLGAVYARIDELEKSELEDPRYRLVDAFPWPLGSGLCVLLLGLLLEVLWLRRVP